MELFSVIPQALGKTSSPTFTGLTLSGLTQGSVLFAGASGVLSQDNSNLFWNDSNNWLGSGTATPRRRVDILDASNPQLRLTQADDSKYVDFQVNSSGDLILQPSPVTGKFVFNQPSPVYGFDIGTYQSAAFRIKRLAAGNTGWTLDTTTSGDTFLQFRGAGAVRWQLAVDDTDRSFQILWGGTIGEQVAIYCLGGTLFVGYGDEHNPETLAEWSHAQPYLTLHNTTHEDTDGGRESRLNFKGEQSGGEETTLARIEISHDGAVDDEKGKVVISTNAGSDTDTPTDQFEIQSTGDLVVNKTSGVGIKVDLAAPTFGWRDLEGFEIPDPTGGDRPTLSTYSGGLIKENAFSNGDVLRIRYHIPHDYVKGTDIFSHIHWSHNGTAISGNVVFGVTSDYAKGHNQANFGTEKSISIPYTTTDISTTPRYRHRIEESAITNDGGSATLIDRGLLEPDGIILVTFEVTTNPTITGGSPNNVFVHRADLHYQSTNIATKQKAHDFYT